MKIKTIIANDNAVILYTEKLKVVVKYKNGVNYKPSFEKGFAYAVCKLLLDTKGYSTLCKGSPSAAVTMAKVFIGEKNFDSIVEAHKKAKADKNGGDTVTLKNILNWVDAGKVRILQFGSKSIEDKESCDINILRGLINCSDEIKIGIDSDQHTLWLKGESFVRYADNTPIRIDCEKQVSAIALDLNHKNPYTFR